VCGVWLAYPAIQEAGAVFCDTDRLDRPCAGVQNPLMQGISRGLRHLAIIALLVRAMLPAGWMPDAQGLEKGLVICSLSPIIHHDGGQRDQHQTAHQECAFATAAQLAAAPEAANLALPAFHAFAAQSDRSYSTTVAAHFTPQSPRAPPLNA
jgi:hypothetical protein